MNQPQLTDNQVELVRIIGDRNGERSLVPDTDILQDAKAHGLSSIQAAQDLEHLIAVRMVTRFLSQGSTAQAYTLDSAGIAMYRAIKAASQ